MSTPHLHFYPKCGAASNWRNATLRQPQKTSRSFSTQCNSALPWLNATQRSVLQFSRCYVPE